MFSIKYGSHLRCKTTTSVMHSYPCIAKYAIYIKIPCPLHCEWLYTSHTNYCYTKLFFVAKIAMHFSPNISATADIVSQSSEENVLPSDKRNSNSRFNPYTREALY